MFFISPNIEIATIKDIEAIKNLLNSAYRGEASKKGWTTEAHLIAGDVRTNDLMVKQAIENTQSVMLTYTLNNQLVGCVHLDKHKTKVYLGMFSVNPNTQGNGIGKQLLAAAEEYALSIACNSIYMTVISVRTELINWYKRNGYVETGETKPFIEDNVTGKHLKKLEFLVLEKNLG